MRESKLSLRASDRFMICLRKLRTFAAYGRNEGPFSELAEFFETMLKS